MSHSHAFEAWQILKPARHARHGLVASQHWRASEIGAQVLREGGNAVDAALATSFAIGVLEPWMSGLGGGGFMLIHQAGESRSWCIDGGMVAPRGLDPEDYPLTGEQAGDLFGWPQVADDRNLRGPLSMAVPGLVALQGLAHERFGTRDWAELMAPAIELAEAGLEVDWYATLKITAAARDLTRDPESRRIYLPDGFPPAAEWGGAAPRIALGRLADTLKQLAEAGSEDFYRGALAHRLIADVHAGGGRLDHDDLADYQARLVKADTLRYRDAAVDHAPGLSAGPSLAHALRSLEDWQPAGRQPDAATYTAWADSLKLAYAERLASMGHANPDPGCTTHISVVDREGNLVALTQTLLSVFGSRTVLPDTGILMNNGIMWFDPRPGRPNSIAPGRRPLANMCPTVIRRDDGLKAALGASGGRRIMPAVLQLSSLLIDYRFDLDAAFDQPRIDVSGTNTVTLDARLEPGIRAALAEHHDTVAVTHAVYPNLFACPNAVCWQEGRQSGAAFIPSPWAAVVTAD
jgi:gamma-glutamyltranspeptidase / glutathione hydrolase